MSIDKNWRGIDFPKAHLMSSVHKITIDERMKCTGTRTNDDTMNERDDPIERCRKQKRAKEKERDSDRCSKKRKKAKKSGRTHMQQRDIEIEEQMREAQHWHRLQMQCLRGGKPSTRECIACLAITEFQKRGLPHAHVLFVVDPNDHPRNPEDVDQVISRE